MTELIGTEEPALLKDSYRAELELVLLGVAIAKASRQRVIDAFPTGTFSKTHDQILGSIRSDDPNALLSWLSVRSAKPEKGEDVIQSIIHTIDRDNRHQKVKSICRSLDYASRISSVDELKDRLERALKELESI